MGLLRIIVPVKQVPETGKARMDEETGTIQREGVESIINPLDLYAIETALRIAEPSDGEVVALSMGPPGAHEALREAILRNLPDLEKLDTEQLVDSRRAKYYAMGAWEEPGAHD